VNFTCVAIIFTSQLPLCLSSIAHFTCGVVDCGDRVSKSSADEDSVRR
jgi:hypothetical protein